MSVEARDTNDTAVKGIIAIALTALVAGTVLAGMGKEAVIITAFVMIASNVASGILGYLTGKQQSKMTTTVSPDGGTKTEKEPAPDPKPSAP